MAQALFDALGVGMDNQTALAVQSLLDSQSSVQDQSTSAAEEEDVFQCGKCKKQFSNLPAFMAHKRERCLPVLQQNQPRPVSVTTTHALPNPNSAFTTSVQHHTLNRQVAYPVAVSGPVPSSPLTQNMNMLNDDMLMSTFGSMDQSTLPTTAFQTGAFQSTPVQTGPFLHQVQPQRTSSIPTTVQTVQPGGFSTVNAAALTNTVTTLQHTQIVQSIQQQQPHMTQISVAQVQKQPSPPKQMQPTSNRPNVNVITDVQAVAKRRRNANQESVKKPGKLKCTFCDKTFNKNFDLQQHIRSHTGEKPFQCIVCGRAFAQKSNVKKHMQTHKVWPHGTGNTLPKQVPGGTSDVSDDESTQQSSENATSPVQMQHQVEKSIDTDKDGIGIVVVVDNSYLCQYCPMTFKSYFQLKSHMTQHKTEQVYKCILKTCGMTWKDLDSFLEHTKTHENEMSYRCHLCNKHFPSLYELGVHQYSHSLYPNQGPKPGPRYFRCNKCMNKYATPEALDHHLATTSHSYPCPNCDKVFPCERYLRRHLPVHGTMGEHVCDHCKKRFKTEHYLKMHVLIHTGVKPFKCEQCEAAFNRKDKLKRHLLIHDPIKKFKCPFRTHTGCTKEFNRPDKLKAHIIAHSGIKPYKCKYCSKSFSRKPHMLEHERMHTDDYNIRCEKCKKGFARDKYLKEHKCRPGREAKKIKEVRDDNEEDEEEVVVMKKPAPKRRTTRVKITEKTQTSRRSIRKRGRPPRKVTKVTTIVTEVEESHNSTSAEDIQKDLERIKAQMIQNKTTESIMTVENMQKDMGGGGDAMVSLTTDEIAEMDAEHLDTGSLGDSVDASLQSNDSNQATLAAAVAAQDASIAPGTEASSGETATSLLESTSMTDCTEDSGVPIAYRYFSSSTGDGLS
ncbi:zinc finger protein 341-like [Saccoglossus kowalevskii]|uniref:Zinc finger protein 341-like n=1 Tax=Saccoglossus kowalevskii TaxID=10224 RepID=A0ABM0MYV0_SACKO|nr:PREDICTED: zinc finger protein 341-like [Saccoglossus kowalevskii]